MNTNHDFLLTIDPKLPIPFQIQLKEQIKWMITIQIWQPNYYLPSVNDLAAMLNINRNTVHTVYTQLRDEGWLQTTKGKGTCVADVIPLREFSDMCEYIKTKMNEARFASVDPADIPLALFAVLQLYGADTFFRKRALFIETEHPSELLKAEIAEKLDAEIKAVAYDLLIMNSDIRDKLLDQADYIVTTYNGLMKVKNLLGKLNKRIVTVGELPY